MMDAVNLPPVKGFENLSHDAQRVMLSLQRKYAKIKEQFLASQMKKELFSQDPSEYYKSLYSRQFKAEPPRSNKSSPYINQHLQPHSIYQRTANSQFENSQRQTIEDDIAIKQEPESPAMSGQLSRGDKGASVVRDYQHPYANTDFQFPVPEALPIRDEMQNRCFVRNQNRCVETVTLGKGRKRTLEERDVEHYLHQPQTLFSANDGEEIAFPIGNNPLHTPIESNPSNANKSNMDKSRLHGSSQESLVFPVPDLEISLEDSQTQRDSFINQASQDLFLVSQNHEDLHQDSTNDYFERQRSVNETSCDHNTQFHEHHMNNHQEQTSKTNRERKIHEGSVSHRQEHPDNDQTDNEQNVHDREDSTQGVSLDKRNRAIEAPAGSAEDTLSDAGRCPMVEPAHPIRCQERLDNLPVEQPHPIRCQARLDNFLERPVCAVARKLEFNKKIRRTESGKKSVADKPDCGKKKPSKSTKVEYSDNTSVSNLTNQESDQTDIQQLSANEKADIRDKILTSDTVCLTLVFSHTTLIRCFNSHQLQLKGIAIMMFSGGKADKSNPSHFFFPCTSTNTDYLQWFKTLVKDVMKSKNIEKVALNAKQLCKVLLNLLVDTDEDAHGTWRIYDPVVGAWLLNSDKSPKCLQDVLKESGLKNTISVTQGSVDADLCLTHEVMNSMKDRLRSRNLWRLFNDIETPLIPLLAQLELQKFLVDTNVLLSFSQILKRKLSKLEEMAFESVGHKFCLNSHPQLRQVLYEELRLDERLPAKSKIAKTSVAHQKSTSEVTLTQLKDTHTLPAIVLEYRQLQKLCSTYVDGMMSCVKNGHLSTHWDQTAAATGRLTSCQPNIQAIPKTPVTIKGYQDNFIIGKESEASTEIYAREPFISQEGHLLLAADFQQIELRLLAHLADDPVLLDIFNSQTDADDIFINLTSLWLGKPVADITAADREQTKRIVYSVMYGVGKERLSEYLKVSPDNAKAIMNSFLLKFPAVNTFTRTCVEFCQQKGYNVSIFKRKRFIPHIHHNSHQVRAQAGRQAVNFCVQGSAADLCKAAMLQVQDQLAKHSLANRARLLAQIHDELLWEVEEKCIEEVKGIVKKVMEDGDTLCGERTRLKVPIRVRLCVGKSWAHLKNSET